MEEGREGRKVRRREGHTVQVYNTYLLSAVQGPYRSRLVRRPSEVLRPGHTTQCDPPSCVGHPSDEP